MTVKRFGAFVAAALMIVGAVFLRSWLDNREDNSTSASDGSAVDDPSRPGDIDLLCSTEFTVVCDKLRSSGYEATSEPAGQTLDRLKAADAAELPDVWLTVDPFPAMLDEYRTRSATPLPAAIKGTPQSLGAAQPVMAVPQVRAAALATACPEPANSSCVVGLIGKNWSELDASTASGPVLLGIDDPESTASGLLALAHAIAGRLGSLDLTGAVSDSGVLGLTRSLADGTETFGAGGALTTMIGRTSLVNLAFATSADTAGTPSGGRLDYEQLVVGPAFPVIAVWAVIGEDDPALRRAVTAALTSAGWASSSGAPSLSASTFIQLRQLWKDNT